MSHRGCGLGVVLWKDNECKSECKEMVEGGDLGKIC